MRSRRYRRIVLQIGKVTCGEGCPQLRAQIDPLQAKVGHAQGALKRCIRRQEVFGKRLACRRAPALLCSRRLKLNETHTLATRAVGYTHHDPYAVPCDSL